MENLNINDKINWIKFKIEIISSMVDNMCVEQKQIVFNSIMVDIFGADIARRLAEYDTQDVNLGKQQEIIIDDTVRKTVNSSDLIIDENDVPLVDLDDVVIDKNEEPIADLDNNVILNE